MTLLILRGIVGFGLGGAHVFTTWGMEFVPTLNTGILMIGLFACCSIGTSLEALLAWVRLKHIHLNNYVVLLS